MSAFCPLIYLIMCLMFQMLGNLLSVSACHGLTCVSAVRYGVPSNTYFAGSMLYRQLFYVTMAVHCAACVVDFVNCCAPGGVFLKLKVHWSLFLGFGKPENFWKLYRCQGNVGISVKIWELSGNNLIRENCPNTSLLNVAHLCFSCIIYICVISELLLGLGLSLIHISEPTRPY